MPLKKRRCNKRNSCNGGLRKHVLRCWHRSWLTSIENRHVNVVTCTHAFVITLQAKWPNRDERNVMLLFSLSRSLLINSFPWLDLLLPKSLHLSKFIAENYAVAKCLKFRVSASRWINRACKNSFAFLSNSTKMLLNSHAGVNELR